MKRIVVYPLILLALGAGAFVWANSKQDAAPMTKLSKELYLTAQAPLEAGKFITPRDIAWKEVNMDELKARGIPLGQLVRQTKESKEMLTGAVPRIDVSAGAYVTESSLVKPTDADFLPSVLKPGHRAVAIGVTTVTGGAGLFRPGNTVDVLLTTGTGKRSSQKTPALAKTLLQGVRILAVNRDMGISGTDKEEGRASRKQETVTLEVLPKDAEVVVLAGSMGELSLSLCSNESAAVAEHAAAGVTNSSEIVALPEEKKEAEKPRVVTMYGSAELEKITK